MLDIGPLEMVALVIVALVVFGPDKLPYVVSRMTRTVREVRAFTQTARAGLRHEMQSIEAETRDLAESLAPLGPPATGRSNGPAEDTPPAQGNAQRPTPYDAVAEEAGRCPRAAASALPAPPPQEFNTIPEANGPSSSPPPSLC